MPSATHHQPLRWRKGDLVAWSALAQLGLSAVAWYIQAGWLSLTLWGVVALLAIVTWVVPGIVAVIRAERQRAVERRRGKGREHEPDGG